MSKQAKRKTPLDFTTSSTEGKNTYTALQFFDYIIFEVVNSDIRYFLLKIKSGINLVKNVPLLYFV